MFSELLPLLTTKAVSLKVRGELYKTCVRPVMLYGSETWPVKAEDTQRLHRNEMSMIQWMCGAKLKDNKSCVELRLLLGIDSITSEMQTRRLRWFGHIERRDESDWLKRVQHLEVNGSRGRGRPQKTWSQVIEDDIRSKNIPRKLGLHRGRWRSRIK